ncbi:DNA integrity scanning protein DisA [Andreesenia angusta]|uniref:Diadenylate cyclase n=1 Tax=Andreesenia angusta TaxID=39480 RepID=A0A1S1V6G4_9FIRM|nr:diadenylate cyclase CdaA [Andreesenia angusta]OHW62122.1 DNA integrity scanning protein DisA [Andreesenia angusta]
METIRDIALNIRIRDLIDMGIVAFVIYKIFMLIRETRAEQLLKGILILLVVTQLSKSLELYTIYWTLEKTMNYGVIAIFIVFQNELRKGLEYIGRTKFFTDSIVNSDAEAGEKVVEELMETIRSLSQQKIGGLVVFEREIGLNEIAETGVSINGDITANLLGNIFYPNTPLHDGAVIIKGNKIKAAGCFLPLSENYSLNKTIGTRHRAALGITEISDCLTLIVSEETGIVSIAERGKLMRAIDMIELKGKLAEMYSSGEKKKGMLARWRNRNEKNKVK